MKEIKSDIVVVLGPTASGKTAFAAHLAREFAGEVISADSRQVYREMDIGTGKDYGDYKVGEHSIPCHLIDIAEPGTRYNVYEYQKDFLEVFQHLKSKRKLPVLCGGSGLYIEAVLKGYKLIHVPPDHELRNVLYGKPLDELKEILLSYRQNLHNTTDLTSVKRAVRAIEIAKYYSEHPEIDFEYPDIHPFIFGIAFDRPTQRRRITERLKHRLENGMIEEVEYLMKKGLSSTDLEYYGLEYKYVVKYIVGELTYEAMFGQLNTAIHQFAKRQMTWFRKMERNDMKIHWIDGYLTLEDKLDKAKALLSRERD
ncbi:MAG: tRNA (adenosine(37)-N6)-dimethylallyltransferase MiaA [Bacteroidales bacterium]